MNKKSGNLPKPKKDIFKNLKKERQNLSFKNPASSPRVRSLGGHR